MQLHSCASLLQVKTHGQVVEIIIEDIMPCANKILTLYLKMEVGTF